MYSKFRKIFQKVSSSSHHEIDLKTDHVIALMSCLWSSGWCQLSVWVFDLSLLYPCSWNCWGVEGAMIRWPIALIKCFQLCQIMRQKVVGGCIYGVFVRAIARRTEIDRRSSTKITRVYLSSLAVSVTIWKASLTLEVKAADWVPIVSATCQRVCKYMWVMAGKLGSPGLCCPP